MGICKQVIRFLVATLQQKMVLNIHCFIIKKMKNGMVVVTSLAVFKEWFFF